MAGIFRVTELELQFLCMFLEVRGLYGFDEVAVIETEAEAEGCEDSLCEKGYLRTNEEKQYEADPALELIITAAENPYGYLIMENMQWKGSGFKAVVYFLNDVIGIIEKRNDNYELIWVPYLPLAIGETANLQTTFLNEKTEWIEECLVEEREKYISFYEKSGFAVQWDMWGRQLTEEGETCSVRILTNGKEQILIKERQGKVNISKPDKASYVNSIAEWLVFLHGNAIKAGGQEESIWQSSI